MEPGKQFKRAWTHIPKKVLTFFMQIEQLQDNLKAQSSLLPTHETLSVDFYPDIFKQVYDAQTTVSV